ncbi:MAG: PAS domain-containing protein, partial [Calothrix sp. SM1_5_4]|nr:PAS domain-containing protein [Calothrix sp. SM1_5_4]
MDIPVEHTQIPDYFSPALRDFAANVIVRSMREVGHWRGESYFRNWKTEELIPVSGDHFMIRDPQSQRVLGMGAIARDITKQKRLEREQKLLAEVGSILASTLDYEATLDNILRIAARDIADFCIVYVVGQDGKIRRSKAVSRDSTKAWICDRLMSMPFGRSRWSPVDEVIGAKRSRLVTRVSAEMLESVAHNEEHLEALRAADVKSFIVAPLLVHGRPLGAISLMASSASPAYTSEDLNLVEEIARRSAMAIDNAQLYREAQRAKLIADNIPAMMAYWDRDQRCQFANHAYLDWFGVDPKDLVGTTMLDLFGPELHARNLPYIEGALNGVTQSFERDLRMRSTGEIRHVVALYIPEKVNKTILGFFVLVFDVTELKETQILLMSEKEKAIAAVKTREDVLSIVSHDLRSPLATIDLALSFCEKCPRPT